MSFAYCSFRKHGNAIIEARARSPRSLRAPGIRSADASGPAPAKVEKAEPAKTEPALELRSSQQ